MSLSAWLGLIMMRGMVIDMDDKQLLTLARLQAFLEGRVAVGFAVAAEERYDFIARTLSRFAYRRLRRPDKAVVLRFLERVSGYLRQQLTRLVKRGGERGPLTKRYHGSRTSFARASAVRFHRKMVHSTRPGAKAGKLGCFLAADLAEQLMSRYGSSRQVRRGRTKGASFWHLAGEICMVLERNFETKEES